MPDISITVEGVDRVMRKLGALEGTRVLERPMQQSVRILERDMKEYPPKRAGSRYVRGRGMMNADGVVKRITSEKLGSQWTARVTIDTSGVRGRVGNITSYAPFVQSRQFQAAVHRGRWQTDYTVIMRRRGEIVDRFQAAIRRALGGK